MVKKVLGYVFAGAGVLVSLASFPKIRVLFKIALPAAISDNTVFIVGMGLLIIGAIFSFGTGGSSKKEVPIYQGDKIVGYRRH